MTCCWSLHWAATTCASFVQKGIRASTNHLRTFGHTGGSKQREPAPEDLDANTISMKACLAPKDLGDADQNNLKPSRCLPSRVPNNTLRASTSVALVLAELTFAIRSDKMPPIIAPREPPTSGTQDTNNSRWEAGMPMSCHGELESVLQEPSMHHGYDSSQICRCHYHRCRRC